VSGVAFWVGDGEHEWNKRPWLIMYGIGFDNIMPWGMHQLVNCPLWLNLLCWSFDLLWRMGEE
jgi:hypothetical protein